jgi:hypothetical protein
MTCIAFVDPPDADGVIAYDEWNLRPVLTTIAVLGMVGIVAMSLVAPFLVGLTGVVADLGAAAALAAAGFTGEMAMVGALGR